MKTNKIILWGLVILAVLGLTFYSLGYRLNKEWTINEANTGGSIPSECQQPPGQDLASWTEHLGHHAETKYCLQYFK